MVAAATSDSGTSKIYTAPDASAPPMSGNPSAGAAPPPPAPAHATASALPPPKPHRARGGLRRLLASTVKIVDLQIKIWLTHAKLTLQKMMLYAGLFGAAILLGILAIIFLYIGVFKLLTDVIGLRPVWAYLIYGGLHLAIAITLIMVGTSILGKKDDDDDAKKKDKHEKQDDKHKSR